MTETTEMSIGIPYYKTLDGEIIIDITIVGFLPIDIPDGMLQDLEPDHATELLVEAEKQREEIRRHFIVIKEFPLHSLILGGEETRQQLDALDYKENCIGASAEVFSSLNQLKEKVATAQKKWFNRAVTLHDGEYTKELPIEVVE